VVVILPDSIRNYLSKFVSDGWMRQHGFLQSDWELGTMGDVMRSVGARQLITLPIDAKVGAATELFKEHGISQIPVVDGGRLVGILTELDVMQQLVSSRAEKGTTVAEAMVRRVSTVDINAPAGELLEIFERGEVALVIDGERHLLGLVTKMDLIDIVAGRRTTSKHAPGGA
jgi:cystathionine beta-synthase